MKRLLKFIKYGFLFCLLLLVGYGSLYLIALFKTPLVITSTNSYILYDNLENTYNGFNNEWVSIDDISQYLIDATIAIEDKNFYEHIGFDYLRMVSAVITNLTAGETLQGASTITQQYAKNLFLTFDKTWSRKIEEAWLTIQIETHYSKDEILEGYLNTINYGGVFGIENASKYYFNVSASELTLAQASMLAGIPKSPSNYSPLLNNENAINRQNTVLYSMVNNNYITNDDMNEALVEELVYTTYEEDYLKTLNYYQDAVLEELSTITTIPDSYLSTGGIKIYTNLDMDSQQILEDNIDEYLEGDLQVSAIMMTPDDGKVIALVGGSDYSTTQFNRATASSRQIGSTIKPFLYYSALESGFTASTTFISEETIFVFDEDQTYSPSNFNNKYADDSISLAAAISYSDNIYAVKTHIFLGEETLVDISSRVGLSNNFQALPSLALGAQETSLMDLVNGYSVLANEGNKVEPYFITKVEDMYGNLLYEHIEEEEQVLNSSLVYVLNELLTNCYNVNFIDYNYPTCTNIIPNITNTYAIKTGSTNSDSYIVGYNKSVLLAVWNGYDDNTYLSTQEGIINKNIWVQTMEEYFLDKEDLWYDTPQNVVAAFVDPISGEVNNNENSVFLYYIKGTEPTSDNNLDSLIPTIKVE
ncbi:MAG: transglycosylase domain-containing protein [Mycoplasmatota bacterium]